MASTVSPRLRDWLTGLGLFAGTVLLFSRALSCGFTNYDDVGNVTGNEFVQHGLTWAGLRWAFTGGAIIWNPLTRLSLLVDGQLFGSAAWGYHLTSMLWHAGAAVLVWLAWRRLTGAQGTSVLMAALWAWHPLRVESVAWISERKDVMSTAFALLAVWAYAVAVERERTGGAGGRRFRQLALAAFAAGLLCKPMVVTLPFALLLLDFWPLRRVGPGAGATARRWWNLVWGKWPYFALAAVFAVIAVRTQEENSGLWLQLPFGARLANAVVAIPRYLGKFFWPFDLAVAYPHPGWWPATTVAGAAAVVLALTVLALGQWRRRPWLVVGWLWFLGMLVPVSGLVQVGFQSMADRYTYLPILGVEVALLWTLREWRPGWLPRWWPVGLGAVGLGFCSVRTWQQQAVWRDSVTLYEYAIQVTERNDAAHAFLAYTLLDLGRTEEAAVHSRAALAINRRIPIALIVQARLDERAGRFEAAIAGYQAAVRLDTHDLTTADSLARLLLHQGRSAEAAAEFRRLIKADDGDAAAHFGLGQALAALGRADEALASWETAVNLRPEFVEAQVEVGRGLLERGKVAEAETHFAAAVKARPNFGLAHFGLAKCAERTGRPAEAMASLERAAGFASDDPAVQRAWADALARSGRIGDAVPVYRRVVQLLPGDAAGHAALGYALYLSGQHAEGLRELEEALRHDPKFPGLRERLERLRGR